MDIVENTCSIWFSIKYLYDTPWYDTLIWGTLTLGVVSPWESSRYPDVRRRQVNRHPSPWKLAGLQNESDLRRQKLQCLGRIDPTGCKSWSGYGQVTPHLIGSSCKREKPLFTVAGMDSIQYIFGAYQSSLTMFALWDRDTRRIEVLCLIICKAVLGCKCSYSSRTYRWYGRLAHTFDRYGNMMLL